MLGSLLSPIFVAIFTLTTLLLQHKYADRRTKKHRRLFGVSVILLAATLFVNLFVTCSDNVAKKQLVIKLDSANSKIDTLSVRAVRQGTQVDSLEKMVGRLDSIAVDLFPELPSVLAIDSLGALVREAVSGPIRTSESSIVARITEPRFRPLSSQRRLRLTFEIRQLVSDYAGRIKLLTLWCQEGNRDRILVAKQLSDLLNGAGVTVMFQTGTILGRAGTAPLVFEYDPNDETIIRDLAKTLSTAINGKCEGFRKPGFGRGSIVVRLFGDPLFADDGLAQLR